MICYTTYRLEIAGQANLIPCVASLIHMQYYVQEVILFPSKRDASPLKGWDCVLNSEPALAHGTTGAKRTVGVPPIHKDLQPKKKKKCEALQYCDSNEFIELTVGTLCVLMSKAETNNICSNKHKA
jgi:hypothetical protein